MEKSTVLAKSTIIVIRVCIVLVMP